MCVFVFSSVLGFVCIFSGEVKCTLGEISSLSAHIVVSCEVTTLVQDSNTTEISYLL